MGVIIMTTGSKWESLRRVLIYWNPSDRPQEVKFLAQPLLKDVGIWALVMVLMKGVEEMGPGAAGAVEELAVVVEVA